MSNDKPSPEWAGRRIDFTQFAAELVKRRAELGEPLHIPRNSGECRTESKRALLAAIEATGKRW